MLTDGDDAQSNAGCASKLTKTGLIEEVSRITEMPRQEAAFIVDRILDSMVRAIDRGDKVEIRGFGSFRTKQRRARVGRNPKTCTRVEVTGQENSVFQTEQRTSETDSEI